jgi:predicted O-methyltransferase YrrM
LVNTTELLLRAPRLGRAVLHAKAAVWERMGRSSIPALEQYPDLPHALHGPVRRMWTMLVGGRVAHADQLFGMMRFAERVALVRYAAQAAPGQAAVELGAHSGVSTCFLAAGLRYAGVSHLWAVDTFANSTSLEFEREPRARHLVRAGGSMLPTFRRNLAIFDAAEFVTAAVGTTAQVARTWPGDAIGLLLVDADHSYESCRDDFLTWEPWLAADALVLFHDYEPHYPGVIQAVDEFIAVGKVRLLETVCTLKICRSRDARDQG